MPRIENEHGEEQEISVMELLKREGFSEIEFLRGLLSAINILIQHDQSSLAIKILVNKLNEFYMKGFEAFVKIQGIELTPEEQQELELIRNTFFEDGEKIARVIVPLKRAVNE